MRDRYSIFQTETDAASSLKKPSRALHKRIHATWTSFQRSWVVILTLAVALVAFLSAGLVKAYIYGALPLSTDFVVQSLRALASIDGPNVASILDSGAPAFQISALLIALTLVVLTARKTWTRAFKVLKVAPRQTMEVEHLVHGAAR